MFARTDPFTSLSLTDLRSSHNAHVRLLLFCCSCIPYDICARGGHGVGELEESPAVERRALMKRPRMLSADFPSRRPDSLDGDKETDLPRSLASRRQSVSDVAGTVMRTGLKAPYVLRHICTSCGN